MNPLIEFPCRTAAEFGNLGSGLSLDHLAELQADAVAKGALNMDRQVEAAAVRGALHLERSQPLSNLEISALAQKVRALNSVSQIALPVLQTWLRLQDSLPRRPMA